MISFATFIQQSPKNYLNNLHKQLFDKKGLIKNAEIIDDISSWHMNEDRLDNLFSSMSQEQKSVLAYVYASGTKGVSIVQLTKFCNFKADETNYIVDYLCWHQLVYRAKSNNSYLFGFSDLMPKMQHQTFPLEKEEDAQEHPSWVNYQNFFGYHLFSFCSEIQSQKPKLTNAGELNKRFYNQIAQRFGFSHQLSTSITTDEMELIFTFLLKKELIHQINSIVYLTPNFFSFIKKNTEDLKKEILDWWVRWRFPNNTKTLKLFFKTLQKHNLHVNQACDLFWVYDSYRYKNYDPNESGKTWEDLPTILKEMWLIGLIEFANQNGLIKSIRFTETADKYFSKSESVSAPAQIFSTHDFEVFFPIQNFGADQFYLELISSALNDEVIIKYKLEKDKLLSGLNCGIDTQNFISVIDVLNLPDTIYANVKEWLSEHLDSEILDVKILKIHDQTKLSDLSEFPTFTELVKEVIPEYGFIFDAENEEKIREFLSHFNLKPAKGEATENNIQNGQVIQEANHIQTNQVQYPEHLKIQYSLKKPKELNNVNSIENSKYSKSFKKLDFNQIIQVIKYSLLMEEQVEVIWAEFDERDRETKLHDNLKPIELDNRKDPITFVGENNKAQLITIPVNNIKNIRVIE